MARGAGQTRPQVLREIEVLARVHTSAAIETLSEICTDAEQPAMARVSAANALLDRGWGRPKQVVDVGNGMESMNDEQLAAAIASKLTELGVARAGDVGSSAEGSGDGGALEESSGFASGMVH